MKAQDLCLGNGVGFATAQRMKLITGQADVVQQMIVFAFQQERGRAAQLQKGEEAGEHDLDSFV
jgi:hypothetical protein